MSLNIQYYLYLLITKSFFLNPWDFEKHETSIKLINVYTPIVTESNPKKMETEKLISRSIGHFSFDLNQNLDNSKNIIFSPLSISSTFSILSQGANNVSLDEIKNVFHLGSNLIQLSDFHKKIFSYYKSYDPETTSIKISNVLLISQNLKILPNFAYSIGSICEIVVSDFENSDGVKDAVNLWVRKETNDKISEIISRPFEKNTKLAIVNAIYFKGVWQKPFSKSLTRLKLFKNYDSTESEVLMMSNQDNYKYKLFENYSMEMIELAYKGNLSMLIMLPKEGNLTRSILNELSFDKIISAADLLKEQQVSIHLPKFKYEFMINLKTELKKLGLISIFDSDLSQLDAIATEPLYVSQAIHKATIEVNEEGTEATAATFVKLSSRSMFMGPEMIVNRPFSFIIKDNLNSIILFSGSVRHL